MSINWQEQYEREHALALSQAENVRSATRVVDETRSTIAQSQGLIDQLRADLASANATIAEQTHRADANDAEAAVWRERCESREELLRELKEAFARVTEYVQEDDTTIVFVADVEAWRGNIAALLGPPRKGRSDG